MGLPDVKITIRNAFSSSGNEKQIEKYPDSVAGMILTGYEIAGKLELGKVYELNSKKDFDKLGVTQENNPLVYKDVSAFYKQAGEEAELFLLVEDVKFSMYNLAVNTQNNELCKLIESGQGRIRLVGVNFYPKHEDYTSNSGFDPDFTRGATGINNTAEYYNDQLNPFRVLIPAYGWNEDVTHLYIPRDQNLHRVSFVMASDAIYYDFPKVPQYTSPAIGRVLGRAVSTPLHQSIVDPELGPIATKGYLSDGSTPEESAQYYDILDRAGYIIFKTMDNLSGYMLNYDSLAHNTGFDPTSLSEARLVDKAMVIVHSTFVNEIRSKIPDENDYISVDDCEEFEEIIANAVNSSIGDYLYVQYANIDPVCNIYTMGYVEVYCRMAFMGYAGYVDITYRFPFTPEREEPEKPKPDDVAGLLLAGYEIPGKLELGKVYRLQTVDDFNELGVTKENNPLVYKDVHAFYAQAGKWAELYLLVEDVEFSMYDLSINTTANALCKLINSGENSIRLVGINIYPNHEDYLPDSGFDTFFTKGVIGINKTAEWYAEQFNFFRVMVPAYGWNKNAAELYNPRERNLNRLSFIMASDIIFNDFPNNTQFTSPAIGQVLGRTVDTPLQYSIADYSLGPIATTGYLSDGSTPEESADYYTMLDLAGFIIYKTVYWQDGYFLSSDAIATENADCYRIGQGRMIDKTIRIAYDTYLTKIRPNLSEDEDYISEDQWEVFENLLINDVNDVFGNDLTLVSASIDTSSNIYTSGGVEIKFGIYTPHFYAGTIYLTYKFPFTAVREEPFADNVAGLLLSGYEVPGKLELGKVYHLKSIDDYNELGVTEDNNPLVHKDVTAFYEQAGEEAELYLLVVADYTLTDMFNPGKPIPLYDLIEAGEKRIRLVGINIFPDSPNFAPDTNSTGIDSNIIDAAMNANGIAELYERENNYFRILIPTYSWSKDAHTLFNPRGSDYHRVGFLMACDKIFYNLTYAGNFYSPAIGQMLGNTVATPLQPTNNTFTPYPITTTGFMPDGSTPEESAEFETQLRDNGYMFYIKNKTEGGYYIYNTLAGTAASHFFYLNEGMMVDRIQLFAYATFIDEIKPKILDEYNNIPEDVCIEFQNILQDAIYENMIDYMYYVSATIHPEQHLHASGYLEVKYSIAINWFAGNYETVCYYKI